MSRHERYGTRSLVYSKWHRFFLGDREPMIDLDAVEYCNQRGCNVPLVLVETARDVGQQVKPTTVLKRLAERSATLAICVLYKPSKWVVDDASGCGCEPRDINPDCDHGIESLRVKRVWPDQTGWKKMAPEEYREYLRSIRVEHIGTHHQPWTESTRDGR